MKRIFLLIISICLMARGLVQADILTSDHFEETTQILDAGGADQETFSLNFDLLQASFGQTAIGSSASDNFAISGGYLATPPVVREPGQIHMNVTGLINDLTQTGVNVDDIVAEIDGNQFTANDVPLTEGPATIHLIAKDQFNQTTEMDVNFTLDVTPPGRPTLSPVETPTESSIQVISGTKEANTSIWLIKDAQETEAIVDPNLRLYIPADGGDGSQHFVDAGKGHTITAVGDAQIDTDQSQSGGASAYFDGSGDYLTIPDSDDWNFGTSDFTIDFWVKPTMSEIRQYFIEQGSPLNVALCLRVDRDNKLYFLSQTEGGETKAYYITSDFVSIFKTIDNAWHHIEVVRNGTNIYIFVDGVSQALYAQVPVLANSLVNGTTNLFVGADTNGASSFNGWIDELKISVFDEEVVPPDELTTWVYPLSLNEGENNFEIYAKDKAGNESTRVSGEIYLDVQNPNVKIIYPANGAKVNKTVVSVLGTVDDDQTQVTIEANGYFYPAIVQNRMFSVDNVVLLDNTWNAVTAVANSPGGKEFVDPVSIRCETSATLPSTPTLNAVTSPTNQSSQTLSGTKPANTYLWLNGVKRADVSVTSTSWSFNLPLSSRGNPILLYVKDGDSTSAKVSGTVSSAIFYDDTSPTRPLVIDDGTISDSTSSLHAKWTSSDSETDIVDYRVAIGTSKGGQDVMAFISAGTETQITQGGFSLGQGQTYYFTVIAKNAAGTESSPGYSDGIRVNGSVPKITNVSLADKSKIYQGTNGINIAVTAEDKDGDTLEYRFTIDGQIAQNWSVDADYIWNVPANDFGKKHVVVEARDPIGGSAYKDVSVFVVKTPVAAP